MKKKKLQKFESFDGTKSIKKGNKKAINENFSPDINPSNLDYDLLDGVYVLYPEALLDAGIKASSFRSDWEANDDKSEEAWEDWMDNHGVAAMTPQQVYILLTALEKKIIQIHSYMDGNVDGFVVKKAPSFVNVALDQGDVTVVVSEVEISWDTDIYP